MKRKAKKKAKQSARKYVTISLYFSRDQKRALDQIAEWADRTVDDVVSVLLGVAMFMGRTTAVAAMPTAPQVAPDGEPPAPAPPADEPAPSPDAQP